MPLLFVRARLPYHQGANATDVVINDVHFNLTALNHYNYTLYSNGTLSNVSRCYLTFNQYQPHMFSNGSFVNATSCYTPIYNVGRRGSVGLTFGLLFAISFILTMGNLRKHGRRYLPLDKRFSLVGRRWKWYWLLLVAVCGTCSCFMSIDVDRDHLQNLPLILQSFFYTLLTPLLMATVWEAVRHWGAWQERQLCDRDPLAFVEPADSGSRAKQELYLPLVFYAFALLNFFLTIPRSWTPIELQRSPEQEANQARPTATDGRFKAAAFAALASVSVIYYSLNHSIYHYIRGRPGNDGGRTEKRSYVACTPSEFLVAIAILLIHIGYAIASAFTWSVSPMNADVHPGWLYGLGYAPAILLTLLFNLCGYCEPNEDKALILLRGDSLGPKKYRPKRKIPEWWKTGRLSLFARDGQHAAGVKEKPIRGSPERHAEIEMEMEMEMEMGLIKPPSDPALKDGTLARNVNIPAPSTSSTSDRSPFSDGARDGRDYIEETVGRLRRGPEHEDTSDGDHRSASNVSTAAEESPQSETTVLGV